MVFHEVLLGSPFVDGKQEAGPAELLEIQYSEGILLCDIPDAGLGEYILRSYFGSAVERVGEDPVEHLH